MGPGQLGVAEDGGLDEGVEGEEEPGGGHLVQLRPRRLIKDLTSPRPLLFSALLSLLLTLYKRRRFLPILR